MKKTLHLALTFALAGAFGAGFAAPQEVAADQKLFESKKCVQCHSIQALSVEKTLKKDGSKRKGPDLSGVGLKKHADAALLTYLKKETEKKSVYDDKKMVKHKKKFRGSDADLKKVIAFLQSQKSDVKVADDGAADDADDED